MQGPQLPTRKTRVLAHTPTPCQSLSRQGPASPEMLRANSMSRMLLQRGMETLPVRPGTERRYEPSREAAKEYSLGRKPWVGARNDQALKGRKKWQLGNLRAGKHQPQ